jgi:glucan phosphoethanolaminetransferase (alkaline phosphatase superfamily)
MIQRIQTLFLIAAAVLSGLMMTGDLLLLNNGTGTIFSLGFSGLGEADGDPVQRLWPLMVIIAIVPLLAFTAIFLYRKRSIQMRIAMLTLLLSLGTILLGAYYVYMFDRKIDVTIIWKVRSIFPLVSAILAWLAYRSILKDEILVKSYDRLR